MFKMQTDNHNFRKNVAANKVYSDKNEFEVSKL